MADQAHDTSVDQAADQRELAELVEVSVFGGFSGALSGQFVQERSIKI
jgi:hypothetical protein